MDRQRRTNGSTNSLTTLNTDGFPVRGLGPTLRMAVFIFGDTLSSDIVAGMIGWSGTQFSVYAANKNDNDFTTVLHPITLSALNPRYTTLKLGETMYSGQQPVGLAWGVGGDRSAGLSNIFEGICIKGMPTQATRAALKANMRKFYGDVTEAVPMTMASPTVTQASSSALTVTLISIGADHYQERHAPMIPQSGADIPTGWWSAPSVITSGSNITNLDPLIQYEVQVRGVTAGGLYGAWSSSGMGTTATTVANNSVATVFTTTGDVNVDGVLSGTNWTFFGSPNVLTYSFPQNAGHYVGFLGGNYGADENDTGFAGLNASQADYVRRELFYYQQIHNIKYVEIAEDNANPAVLRYAITSAGGIHSYYPSTSPEGGDVWMTSSSVAFTPGSFSCKALIHETGHAHGLKHPHEQVGTHTADRGRIMPIDHDYADWTVMSYRSYQNGPLSYSNETFGYVQSLMRLDILALQVLYGATDRSNRRACLHMEYDNRGVLRQRCAAVDPRCKPHLPDDMGRRHYRHL